MQESDKIAVENTIVMLPIDLSITHLFPNVELENREDEVAFWEETETYGNPVIKIDDVEIELEPVTEEMLAEGVYVQD